MDNFQPYLVWGIVPERGEDCRGGQTGKGVCVGMSLREEKIAVEDRLE